MSSSSPRSSTKGISEAKLDPEKKKKKYISDKRASASASKASSGDKSVSGTDTPQVTVASKKLQLPPREPKPSPPPKQRAPPPPVSYNPYHVDSEDDEVHTDIYKIGGIIIYEPGDYYFSPSFPLFFLYPIFQH